jgi:hypothetical protein
LIFSASDNVGGPTQALDNLLGEMLRINRSGTIPTNNPLYDLARGTTATVGKIGYADN